MSGTRRAAAWLRNRAVALGGQAVGAVVTTAALSFGYMIFNDYVAPAPDLTGSWKFTITYEDTALDRYEDLQVTYQALLVQQGLDVSGSGEKLSDRGPAQDAVDYSGERRTGIELTGHATRNFFSRDALTFHYNEVGRVRESSTVLQLVQCSEQTLCGCFRSTIADSSGPVWWQRRGGLERIYEPVEQPPSCRSAVCSTIDESRPSQWCAN